MKSNEAKRKKIGSTLLALLPAILIGVCAGLSGVYLSELFSDNEGNLPQFFFLLELASLILSCYLQLIVHEVGHLVFGLLSGYRFSSFRIGSLMLARVEGRLRFARLSIAGTAGQCMMAPPAPDENGRIPSVLFNLGGSLMNLLLSAILLILFFSLPLSLFSVFLFICALVGLFLALNNGIPLHMGMIDNDGRNALSLHKDSFANRAFYVQLKVSEQIASGKRLRDMPDSLFEIPEGADRKNPLIATVDVFRCNRLMDGCRFEEAETAIREILSGKRIGALLLYRCLLTCDLICLLIGKGAWQEAAGYLDEQQKRFMKSMRTFPSVIRAEYLIARHITKNKKDESDALSRFSRVEKSYPYPQEIAGERELMTLLDRADALPTA